MNEKSLKQNIDERHSDPAIRRLLYWMNGSDKECAAAIDDPGYTAGNTEFANDVCSILAYLENKEGVKQERDRNLEWALRAMICLAKRCLKDSNDSRESEGDWPAGQDWCDLGHTSQHAFMRAAREECGVSHGEWRSVIEKAMMRDGQDLDKVWEEFDKARALQQPCSDAAGRGVKGDTMPKLTCKKDFVMEDGTLAFRAGHAYEWRWPAREEEAELCMGRPVYVFTSELGEQRFMSYGDVEAAFG